MLKIDKALAERVEQVLATAIKKAETGDAFAAAQATLKQQQIDVLRVLAEAAVVDAIRRSQRERTLDAELHAQHPQRPRRNTRAYAEWLETEEGKVFQAYEADLEKYRSEHSAGLASIIRDGLEAYGSELQMTWTAELLASGFALPDGSVVSWGDATVAQHEARVSMFAANARANIEGAARHAAAVHELEQAGKNTLNALVATAA